MPLSDKETQALYQAWTDQLKGNKKQKQLGMLHNKMRLYIARLPEGSCLDICTVLGVHGAPRKYC